MPLFKSIFFCFTLKGCKRGPNSLTVSRVQLINTGNQLYFKLFFNIEQVVLAVFDTT